MADQLTFFDRLKFAAVIGAIFILIVGISDAFIDTSAVGELVFHSIIFWLVFTGVCLIAAPYIAKVVPVRTESGYPFGAWAIVLMTVVAVVALVSIAMKVIRH
jgi:hypothetical protein